MALQGWEGDRCIPDYEPCIQRSQQDCRKHWEIVEKIFFHGVFEENDRPLSCPIGRSRVTRGRCKLSFSGTQDGCLRPCNRQNHRPWRG